MQVKARVRIALLLLVWILVVGVVLQTALAGFALFGARRYWSIHASLGLVAGPLLGFLLLLLAFASRLPRKTHRLSMLLGFLAILQAALVYPGRLLGLVVQALHPVNALVLFWLGLKVAAMARLSVGPPLGKAEE